MGGGGGKRGGSKGGYKGRHAKTALSRKKARQAASKGYAPAGSDPGNLARAAVAHGDYGWSMASGSGYGSYATPRDQIPGTAEYAQRINKEQAKEAVTKAESGFGDTFKKAMAITGFLTAPGITTGLNLANTFKKKDTDYSKAFAPGQSIADKYGTWSPQNLSRFGAETMDPGNWNLASIDPYAGVRPENEAYRNWLKQQEQRESWEMRPPIGEELKRVSIPNDTQIASIDNLGGYGAAAAALGLGIKGFQAGKEAIQNFSDKFQQQRAPSQDQNQSWGYGFGGELGKISYAGDLGLGIGQNEVGQVTRSNDPIAQENRNILNQAAARLSAQNPDLAKASDRNWSRGLGTDTRAVRSADIRSRGGGVRPLPTLASQVPALKAVQDQQAQAGNLTISDYLKQAQEQSAQNRTALSQLQTGRTDLTAQIEALKKQYGEDVDLTGLQKQSGEFQTAIDQRTADLSAYDQAVRGNVIRQQQMWATPQRTWGVKARTSEYKSPLQQFGRKARQETKKIQTQTPTISNLAATWGNLPVLNV